MFNKKRKAMVIKMKKRIFSAFMSALMLLSSFAFVYADETTAGTSAVNSVWEPSYNASDWTTAEGSTFTFDSSAKSVSFTNNGIQTATYKNAILDGDFIMTADLKINSNRTSVTLGKLELVFLTEPTSLYSGSVAGDIILVSGGNEIMRATGKGVTDWKNAKITVIYKNSGEIMLYRNDDSANKLIIDYNGSDIAGKNDGTLAITGSWTAGSVGNIKMYKRFGGSFRDDFSSENSLTDNWELNNTDGYIRTPEIEGSDNYVMTSNVSDGKNAAELKSIFTTGGYSLSLDLSSYTNNRHYIYFNKTSDKALYSLFLKGNGDKFYMSILKGETEASNTNIISKESEVEIARGLHHVRVDYTPPQESAEGKINVYIDDMTTPKLTAEDSSFVIGKAGVKCTYNNNNTTFDNFEIASLSDVLEVNQPEITGEFANGNTVTGSVKVFNSTKNSIDASVILGIYDNGRLVDVKISKNTIDALCGEKVISASYTFDGYDESKMYSAKCFVFDSMESLKPLAPPAVKYDTHKLILIGDSTCTEYKTDSTNINGQRGWGMYMQEKFDSNYVEVINRAYGGYTAKTFIDGADGDGWAGDKGYWSSIKELISPGDTVLINLGINDQAKIADTSVTDYTSWEQFEGYIDTMVKDVKAKGGEAAVISSSVGVGESFKWGTGESHMQNVADSNSIDCLKLNTMMKENFTKELGEELTKDNAYKLLQKYYCRVIKDGELTDAYDGTHFGEAGARYAADCVATMLKDTGMSIAGKIK